MTKGREKTGGRAKGVQNKTTRLVKEVFSDVFTELQTDPKSKLLVWAKKNPTEFYKLASKLIPTEIAGGLNSDTVIHIIRDKEV